MPVSVLQIKQEGFCGNLSAARWSRERQRKRRSSALGITVAVGAVFMEVVHEYPDLTVHLTLFHAKIAEGEPQKLEHHDIRWITTKEIDAYPFCPADVEILKKLKKYRL